MTPSLDRAHGSPRRWTALALCLTACASGHPGGAPLPEDPTAAELAGGQSGNEGSGTPTPCFDRTAIALEAEVVGVRGGCVTIKVVRWLNAGATTSGIAVGDMLTGAHAPYYTDVFSAVGDRVVALYAYGPNGLEDGSLQTSPLEGDSLQVLWRGAAYASSLTELSSAECRQRFLARPHRDADQPGGASDPEGTLPADSVPTALNCGGTP